MMRIAEILLNSWGNLEFNMHVPVLLQEAIEALNLAPGKKVIDATVGDGGHTLEVIKRIEPAGTLIAIDLDLVALKTVQAKLNTTAKVILVHDNFKNLKQIALANEVGAVDAILLDLGWRRTQFEESGLGFSFLRDEPLDMRFGRGEEKNQVLTAALIVNNWTTDELIKLFRDYGDERLAGEITKRIVAARRVAPISRSGELVEIILATYREKLGSKKEIPWIGGLHPATKVFQALRIAVNDELENLKTVLPDCIELLAKNGRLAVISFHSLEDKIVKQYFKYNKKIKLITKKAIQADEAEVVANPPSRSAKLRVVEKI